LKPLRRVVIAAARPAGPPPMTKMSVFTTALLCVEVECLIGVEQPHGNAQRGGSNVDRPSRHPKRFRPEYVR
jgi:hypothetical protein